MGRTGLLLVLVAAGACDASTTTALFAVSAGETFYDLPYPNDLRRHADGRLDLSLLPTNSLIVDQVRAAAETLDGFGLNAAIYARFDGGLDPASLPDAAGSLSDTSAVYLVNVDPDSPERGQKTPIVVTFRVAGTQTLDGNHLVCRPYPGFPLDEATTYALVITRRVKGDGGNSVAAASDLTSVVGTGGDAAIVHAREVYQPLLDLLDEPGGDERDDVVSAAVFTTQRATHVAPALRKAVFAAAAPVATDVIATPPNAMFQLFTGAYTAPNFQAGDVPYRNTPSGEIKIGSDGAAIIVRSEPMRFALTVPAGPVPGAGWPLVIYSHGTGGSYTSFLEDQTAGLLAAEGLAVISTDQVLHGPRNPGGNPELDFFNFGNAYSARDNALQGIADAFSQLRLVHGLSITDAGRTHTFDRTKIYFFGHSQGGLTGPGFVAFEPSLTGAVLSGTAGLLYVNLLHKTKPLDIPSLVQTFLRDEPVDENNPGLALLQMWVERSDPVNYAPLMVRKPPLGETGTRLAPRNIFQTEGFTDTYSPNLGIEAFATALGADILMLRDTKPIEGVTLRGRAIVSAPVTNNVNGATAALGQYNQQAGSDGHFVVFDIPAAGQHAAKFLGTLARTGQATVVQVP
ncbi:MAG: hypothetical protein H0T42_12715 [Deltaproteobacteria bacterium]|nr:hypothetical protein [Deltaproteobacteria bacterium]